MRKKVLAVDDQNTVLMLECMMLSAAGFDVVTARDGEEALAVAAAERPDLILLDATMPKMDGYDACRALRARPETKNTPILMVTTRAEVNHMRSGYSAGCNEYITKPFNAAELVATVRRHLG
jgi:DNA-binding response OmpR family regulator